MQHKYLKNKYIIKEEVTLGHFKLIKLSEIQG
jgi:hypothetical protein